MNENINLDEPSIYSYLNELNPPQMEAVLLTEGPLLVLAGAGTGKTKVLTTKITHLIHSKKCFPGQILAVTFTNKAAREMRSRVEAQLTGIADGMWLGTFHSIAARILRRHGELIGLTSNFTIIDMDDQLRLIKQIIRDFGYDEKKLTPKLVGHYISKMKDKAILPQNGSGFDTGFHEEDRMLKIYTEYQRRLKKSNAADFGDLLLYNIQLFNEHSSALEQYHNKFKYILVDEYQDTNVSQYMWLRMLAQHRNNICCVGDDDQSIYGWRGAVVTNILRFDKEFQDATIIRLEQNYRSTNTILSAATSIIANNKERHNKTLWTDKQGKSKIKLSSFYDEREEARYIVEEIEVLAQNYRHKLAEIAVLVRAGHQTRSFEEMFNYYKIPYRIIGGVKFYERMEIKDAIAYIRSLINSGDNLAFERIINTPKRGVGLSTMQEIHSHARAHDLSFSGAARFLLQQNQIRGKAASTLSTLFKQFDTWTELLKTLPHSQLVELMLQESGYIEMWRSEATEESKERLENLRELSSSLEEFPDLASYLEHISLVTDTDSMSDDNYVSVMTMHAAKGLEFESVFLGGWEEGLFPSQKSIEESGALGIEEERRLAYVAITRAKMNLYISYACNRRIYGSFQASLPSRFVDELPKASYDIVHNYGSYYNKETLRNLSQKIFIKPSIQEQSEFISEHSQLVDGRNLFHKGQKVEHVKFGFGIVLNVSGDSAEIAFYKNGVKKIMIEFLKVA